MVSVFNKVASCSPAILSQENPFIGIPMHLNCRHKKLDTETTFSKPHVFEGNFWMDASHDKLMLS